MRAPGFFFSSRRRHTRWPRDWSSDVCSSDLSVYKVRLRQGEKLADKILRERPDHDIDVVIPIPDSSRVAGQAVAYNLGVKFREGLIKKLYIVRNFIMQDHTQRIIYVRQNNNTIK